MKLSDFSWHLEGSETAPAMKTRQCGLSPARHDVAKTPAFVFMAKRGVTNSQAFKENLQSDYAISLRMVVNEPPNYITMRVVAYLSW